MKDKMRVGITVYKDVYPSLFDRLDKISSPRQRAARIIALADLGLRFDLKYGDEKQITSIIVDKTNERESGSQKYSDPVIDDGAVKDLADAVKGLFG
jgi:hypothetical protein